MERFHTGTTFVYGDKHYAVIADRVVLDIADIRKDSAGDEFVFDEMVIDGHSVYFVASYKDFYDAFESLKAKEVKKLAVIGFWHTVFDNEPDFISHFDQDCRLKIEDEDRVYYLSYDKDTPILDIGIHFKINPIPRSFDSDKLIELNFERYRTFKAVKTAKQQYIEDKKSKLILFALSCVFWTVVVGVIASVYFYKQTDIKSYQANIRVLEDELALLNAKYRRKENEMIADDVMHHHIINILYFENKGVDILGSVFTDSRSTLKLKLDTPTDQDYVSYVAKRAEIEVAIKHKFKEGVNQLSWQVGH